ncbi:MAG: hypothetical protein IKP69_11465 [Oscillospiraceae bacterium]|nr:hypothetical protein [Oscillospiraceae bacterium]
MESIWEFIFEGSNTPSISATTMVHILLFVTLAVLVIAYVIGRKKEKEEEEKWTRENKEVIRSIRTSMRTGSMSNSWSGMTTNSSTETFNEIPRQENLVNDLQIGCIVDIILVFLVFLFSCIFRYGLIYAGSVLSRTIALPLLILILIVLVERHQETLEKFGKNIEKLESLSDLELVKKIKKDRRKAKYLKPLQWILIVLALLSNIKETLDVIKEFYYF